MPDSKSKLPISEHILVVEDSRIVQGIVNKILSSFTKHPILKAKNGQIALETVEKEPYIFKIIFLDLAMPVMGGVEFVERLRSLKNKKAETTIVAVTGNQKNFSPDELRSIGLNGAIIKPIYSNNVLKILTQLPTPSSDHWFGVIK